VARTRAQRRRHSLFLTIALVATLVVLVFARDISRSAHTAITNQRSENRSFAGLANTLITQENDFDSRTVKLLRSGGTMTRPVFDARLDQLDQQLASWSTSAELLRRPKLAHDMNDKIADTTETRVNDYEEIFTQIARSLSLPTPVPDYDGAPTTDPAASLYTSELNWNKDRFGLRHEPGTVRLDALTLSSAKLLMTSGVTSLTSSPSLAVVRGIGIAAVSVVPAPLPARNGVLLLPPVTDMQLGIAVVNVGFVEQQVTLEVTMSPTNGPLPAHRQTFHVKLAPLQSYAFVPQEIAVVPSERAILDIRITGAPGAMNLSRSKRYRVELSPPGVIATIPG
jgi:hypothetical protein